MLRLADIIKLQFHADMFLISKIFGDIFSFNVYLSKAPSSWGETFLLLVFLFFKASGNSGDLLN